MIAMLAGTLQVGVGTHAEWEAAIVAGLGACRALVEHDDGHLRFDADISLLEWSLPTPPATSHD